MIRIRWPTSTTRPMSIPIRRISRRTSPRVMPEYAAAMALAAQLPDGGPDGPTDSDIDTEVSDDPLVATYHLATLAPIGPADRLRLLSADRPMQRLDLLDEILDDVEAMMKFRLS